MQFRNFRIPCVATLFVSSLLMVVSLSFLVIFPTIYRKQLDDQLTLINGTVLFDLWKDLPLPVFQRLYFFNVTNGAQFVKSGSKLRVTEVGPYTYRSRWVKEDIVWHPNGTLSYREVKTFHFVREESVGGESDVIVTLNGPLVAMAKVLREAGTAAKAAADVFLTLSREKLVIARTVHELAFEGYEDPIVRFGHFLHPEMPFAEGKFGWLYGRNGTDDGVFTVHTGVGDVNKLNLIFQWDGRSDLPYWKAATCNAINGSNGEVSPPLSKNQTSLQFFQPFFCRSVAFEYSRDCTHRGVSTRRFEATARMFADGRSNPDNACFETQPDAWSGAQDISVCQFGVPVWLSFPHFYMADARYRDAVSGLCPNASLHASHVDVEPTTGVSLDLAVRFQVNLQVHAVKDISQFTNVTPGLYPVLWVEMRAVLTPDLALFLQQELQHSKKVGYALLGTASAIFAVLTVGALASLFAMRRVRMEEMQALLAADAPESSGESSKLCVTVVSALRAEATNRAFETSKTESLKTVDRSVSEASKPETQEDRFHL